MTSAGSSKIGILVADWSRVKSSEPNAGDVTRKIGPLYFTYHRIVISRKQEKKGFQSSPTEKTLITKNYSRPKMNIAVRCLGQNH